PRGIVGDGRPGFDGAPARAGRVHRTPRAVQRRRLGHAKRPRELARALPVTPHGGAARPAPGTRSPGPAPPPPPGLRASAAPAPWGTSARTERRPRGGPACGYGATSLRPWNVPGRRGPQRDT